MVDEKAGCGRDSWGAQAARVPVSFGQLGPAEAFSDRLCPNVQYFNFFIILSHFILNMITCSQCIYSLYNMTK